MSAPSPSVDTVSAHAAPVTTERSLDPESWPAMRALGHRMIDDVFAYQSYVHDGGTGAYIPELYLPVGESTRFNLHSPDVVHDFGVPSFLMRMDVVPGRVNHYEITPTREGVFRGRCYELCGVYHSRMLFEVHVVSREEYDQHLQDLEDAGQTSDLPLTGGEDAYTQHGLESEGESE